MRSGKSTSYLESSDIAERPAGLVAPAPREHRPPRLGLWPVVCIAIVLWVLLFTPIGRFLDFDESTFYGQSGGIDGIDAPRPWMAASREQGTSLLISWIRTFTSTLAQTQLVWTVVSIAITLAAFYEGGRWTGRRGAAAGAALYATCWVSTALAGTFYGSFIGAAAAILVLALYLRLRYEPKKEIRNGVLLGLAAALLMGMRNLESVLVLAVVAGHALVWRPREVIRRWRGLVLAAGAFVVVFVIPWTLYTLSRWNSVAERVTAARDQGHPFGLHNGVDDWSRLLFGIDPHLSQVATLDGPLTWIYAAMFVAMALLAGAFVIGFLMRATRREPGGGENQHPLLILSLAVTSLGLFLFFSQDVKERYLAFGLAFGALLVGQALVGVYERWRRRALGRAPVILATAAFCVVWLVLNGVVIARTQADRVEGGAKVERIAHFMSTVASGRRCRALGDASTPQIQIASGCVASGGRGLSSRGPFFSLAALLRDRRFHDAEVLFVVWTPSREDVQAELDQWAEQEGASWNHIHAAPGETLFKDRGKILSYLIRD